MSIATTSLHTPALPRPLVPPGLLQTGTGFLRQAQVLSLAGFSKSTLWRRVHAGSFPAPVKLSERVTAWRVEAILAWLAQPSDSS